MPLLDRLRRLRPPPWIRDVANLFGHRRRRLWHDGARAHVEIRAIPHEHFARFAAAAETTLLALDGVLSVWLSGLLGRALIHYDPQRVDPEAFTAALELVERRLGFGDLPFAEIIPDYPADIAPLARKAVDLGADAIGVLLGVGLKIAGISPSRAGFDLAALLTVVDNTPRVRDLLTEHLGKAAAEVGLGVTNAFVQAIGAGPIGPLVDMLAQTIKLRAEIARRGAWKRREPELSRAHARPHQPPYIFVPRPVPLPEGVVDRYADNALFASLGGFIVGIADTHNLEAATAPLFGGLPKAALYGRTIFAYEVMRALCTRGALILRSSATRILDRVDTLLLTEEALVDSTSAIARILPLPGVAREQVVQRAGMLFDPAAPHLLQEHEGWRLAPPHQLTDLRLVDLPPSLRQELEHPTTAQLILAEGADLRALVLLRPALRRGAEALLAAARRARLHLVLASDTPALARALAIQERVDTQDAESAVRDLQRGGRVVAVVASDAPGPLAAADVGIGLTLDPSRPPWTADLLLRDDLLDVLFILDAITAAREVAEQSVVLAGVGAALGAVIALGGLRRTKPQQVMLATHAASVIALGNGLRRAHALVRQPPPAIADPTPWHRMPIEAVLERLSSGEDGLPEPVAAPRRRPVPRPRSRPRRLLTAVGQELRSPLTPVLLTGAALSVVSGSIADAGMITAVFALNGGLGGYERYRAEAEIAALERRERPPVTVLREGRPQPIPAAALVPGDILDLIAGDVLPADCRVLRAQSLEIDESSLTGESLPIPKSADPSFSPAIAERSSMLYEGTAVAVGRARAVVVATGTDTEARRGGLTLLEQAPETGVEARLRELTEMTLPIAGLSGALLMGVGLYRGQDINRLVDLGVSMTVAAVPEGLPLLATVAQLAAARRLSQRGALVRNPRMVEALGRVDILCADKTGTLTEGKITLHAVADGHRVARCDSAAPEPWARLLLAAALRASPAPPRGADALPHPTDRAVVDGALRLGVDPAEGQPTWQRLHELPFEPGRGYHGVLGRTSRELWISVKGAPEVLLPRCTHSVTSGRPVPLGEAERATILAAAEALAGEGLRVLALAERGATEERDLDDARIARLHFAGFITLSDPPRATAAQAITRLHAAGIDVLMITGDHPRTARRIADELGLLRGRAVLTGPELEALSDDELDPLLPQLAVIARATPAHKVRIVKAQQRAGRVVAMTGDGANDAAAIRLADVGIALGERSTLAARDAAGLIVVDERIETIVDAIAEGRAMWSSVRDAIAILTGGNLGEIGFAVASGVLGGGTALNPRQLLLINLLTDVAPAMAIALRPPSEAALRDLLAEGPKAALGDALNRQILLRAITTASGAGAAWIAAKLIPGRHSGDATVALLALVATQLGQTLVVGAPTREIWAASLGSFALLLAIVETPGLSHLFGCTPIGPLGLGAAFGASALATGAAVIAPPALDHLRELLHRWRRAHPDETVLEIDPHLLPR
ncbi:MAG: HAD-IC family P-type ATPase [Nannocystis sp.]|nr:HAD-IC family P-type ATPase [Nannocystis sp.]